MADIPDGCSVSQKDVSRLEKWAERNLIQFMKAYCEILRLGRSIPIHQHLLGANQLESGFPEKELGILENNTLTMRQQCGHATKAANSLLDCLRKIVARKSRQMIHSLYSALTKPHLECSVQVWSPQHKRDVNILE